MRTVFLEPEKEKRTRLNNFLQTHDFISKDGIASVIFCSDEIQLNMRTKSELSKWNKNQFEADVIVDDNG